MRAYLNRFREQAHTLRDYTKELERLLLWAVVVRGKPMSALLVEDCEAYKDFLSLPSLHLSARRRHEIRRVDDRLRPTR